MLVEFTMTMTVEVEDDEGASHKEIADNEASFNRIVMAMETACDKEGYSLDDARWDYI